MRTKTEGVVFLDGSQLIIEAMGQSGVGAYIGYPITPVNGLFAAAKQRIPIAMEAPDEITALQWSSGFSSSGVFPVTASAFPGFALMIESLNMAFMMELPMVIILAQRLGPSTGSATTGGQGDLLLLRGCISGGYPVPVFCPSNLNDCWELAAASVHTAVQLRTPVVLMTSKEMVMTNQNMDIGALKEVHRAEPIMFTGKGEYKTYGANGNLTAPFLPIGNNEHQVRLNSSTHDMDGITQKNSVEALENTERLKNKMERNIDSYTYFDYNQADRTDTVILTYGISAEASREAVSILKANNELVSLLVMKTLLPVPSRIYELLAPYQHIVIVEENIVHL